jgi:dihydrofolate reductase
MISLIAAVSKNRVIGKENRLPWKLPNDLKYFKQITLGKTIVMGRKTFESIGRPLKGRRNVVLTRDLSWKHQGVEVIHSLEDIQKLCCEEVMIIGGEELYKQIIDFADRLYITYIDHIFEGDAFFLEINFEVWKLIKREKGFKDEENKYDYYFEVYERK